MPARFDASLARLASIATGKVNSAVAKTVDPAPGPRDIAGVDHASDAPPSDERRHGQPN